MCAKYDTVEAEIVSCVSTLLRYGNNRMMIIVLLSYK